MIPFGFPDRQATDLATDLATNAGFVLFTWSVLGSWGGLLFLPRITQICVWHRPV